MKIIFSLLLILLWISIVSVPVFASTPLPSMSVKSSYELFYPIVAGKIPGDKWYGLKIFREKAVGIFLFDVIKKSQYYMSLSKKRLVEAEKLITEKKDYQLGIKTLEESDKNLKTAWLLLVNEDANNELKPDTLIEADFLTRLANEVPPESKSKVNSYSEIARGLIK